MKQRDKSTAQIIHEYGSDVTTYYLIAMLAILPLYYNNGYIDIADAKYKFYRGITIAFLVLAGVICFTAEKVFGRIFKEKVAGKGAEKGDGRKLTSYPIPIILIAAHLLFNMVTWLFSVDRDLSIVGNGSWHMGIISQGLILLAALLVYHYFEDKLLILIAFSIGAGLSSLFIILNGFDIYPLDMGKKFNLFTSTLGQTNWACIYLAVMLGVAMGMFIHEKGLLRRTIVVITQLFIFAGAWEIGSDTILLVMAGEFFVILGICIRERELMKRFSELLITFGISTSVVYLLIYHVFTGKFTFVDEYNDGPNKLLRTGVGFLILAAGILLYMVIYCTKNREWKAGIFKNIYRALVAIGAVLVIGTIAAIVITTNNPEKAGTLSGIGLFNFDVHWGNRRGANWKCAVMAFGRMPFFRQLIGMGQGCYEQYLNSFEDLRVIIESEFGEKALMTAHNEYLNMIVENGILGCFSYIGIIVSSFIIMWKKAAEDKHALMGLIAVTGYVVCSMFCFQHVYGTSFMYMFIAIAMA
ncbi:O-antigen ligase family protein [Butyrivibrio sp. LC3010]|uniref:O-antigen ligase family protein n=1 Tax=Butyrivibrio sp. LC3010 TaxID=1280680 RepID=UPI00041DCABC|nr:O-antigen ligase family protein [Butyrivibrio sp. LC3010]